MKTIIQVILLLITFITVFPAKAQKMPPSKTEIIKSKLEVTLSTGQYTAKIGTPNFTPLRLIGTVGINYRWNNNLKHQLSQSLQLGGFYHKNLQTAIQLYSEFSYSNYSFNQWIITPLSIGGGYVASFSNMTTLEWNGNQYVETKMPFRNNFMVSLGSSFGYKTPIVIFTKPLTLSLLYRLQVQGIMVQSTVPVIGYSSFQIRASFPL